MSQPRLRLGEILIESGLLTQNNLNKALDIQKESQLRLGTILLQEEFITEPHLFQALSRHFSIPWVSIWRIDVSDDIVQLVPSNVAEEFFLMPIYIRVEKDGERALYVAMNDPSDTDALRFVSASAGMDVKPMIASPSDIAAAIRFYYYGEEIESIPPVSPAPMLQSPIPVEDLSDEVELLHTEEAFQEQVLQSTDAHQPSSLIKDSFTVMSIKAPLPIKAEEEQSDASATDCQLTDNSNETVDNTGEHKEIYSNKEAAQREAERRIYGVGRKKSVGGFALTLLDGTTLSFGTKKKSSSTHDNAPRISKKDFFAGLHAAANGSPVEDFLPAEKWQSYVAAMLQLLFKKGLFMYDEFMEITEEIEKK